MNASSRSASQTVQRKDPESWPRRNRVLLTLTVLALTAGLASAQPADVVPPPPVVDTPSPWWGEVDFLTYWFKNDHTPPLVSSGPASSGGILGQGAAPAFGGAVGDDPHFGGLFRVGYWFDDAQSFGVEADYLFLATRTASFADGSNGAPGTPVIARPFFNVNSLAQDSELVAAPSIVAGVVGVALSSRSEGAEIDGVFSPTGARTDGFRLDILGGVRWLQLRETLGVNENLQVLPGVPEIGGEGFVVADQFGTGNDFYGGQIGARAAFRTGPWSLDVCGKLGVGGTHETVNVSGATTMTPPGGPATTGAGGLLALPTNIGHYSHDVVGFVPEAGVTFGYQPIEQVRVFVGYTFLYWSDVARPGNEIDYSVNPARVPVNQPVGGAFGPARPGFTFNGTDFWAQGIQFGAEFRY